MSYGRFVEQERMERNAVNAKRPKAGTPHRDPESWLIWKECVQCGVMWTANRSLASVTGWVGPCCEREAA